MSSGDSRSQAAPPLSAAAGAPRPAQQRLFSLTGKLMLLIVTTTVAVVLLLSSFFLRQQVDASHKALLHKAAAYAALAAREVAPAVAFDDRQTAREVFDAIAQDADIESMTLLNSQGDVLHARGAAGAWIAAAKRGVRSQRLVRLPGKVAVVSPVVSAEGPRGTLVVELSTAQLQATVKSVKIMAMLMGALAILIGMVLAYAIAHSLGRRITAVADAAVALAAGDLAQPALAVKGRDEVSDLARGFNAMMREIQRLFGEAKQTAETEKSRLEHLVQERTQALDQRSADMRLVLDNVDQGFLTVDLQGRMSRERSAIVDKWLGAPNDGETLFEYVNRALPGQGECLRVAWEALGQDWMPLEMRLSQLPAELRSQQLQLACAYQPIFEAGALDKLLLIVTDIAPIAERIRAEAEERELVVVVRKFLSDARGFKEYIAESSGLISDITSGGLERARCMRLLHTLKGNSSVFGFESLVRLCHELEDTLQLGAAELSQPDQQRLLRTWERLKGKLDSLMEGRPAELLEIKRTDLQSLVANLNAGARASTLERMIYNMELEPVEARLMRLGEYASALAGRLEKGAIRVEIESHNVRLHPSAWASFWHAVVHVVRNAVDHGLEDPAARSAAGKPQLGRIRLRTRLEGPRFQLSVEDDGAGVNWTKLVQLAHRQRLPTDTHQQLVAALLCDGISTREHVSATSGRGVGLSAVRETCAAMGGSVEVQSEPGKGTTFSFLFTVDAQGKPLVPTRTGVQPRLAADSGTGTKTNAKERSA